MDVETDASFDTLVIKHFPHQLTKEDKINFLKECGATDVDVIESKFNKYNLVFAKFANHERAKQALFHLHQKPIMGSYLVCEYSKGRAFKTVLQNPPTDQSRVPQREEIGTDALIKKFHEKLNHWTVNADFRIPVPSHLRYRYPPPTQQTLHNIVCILSACPKFYTQVLHLMNKMNLPCPIGTHLPATSTFADTNLKTPMIESESELSSDEEVQRETIPDLKRKTKNPIKRPKIIKLASIPNTKAKKMKFDDVFEDPKNLDKPSKPKLQPIPLETRIGDENQSSGFGFIEPINPPSQTDKEERVDVRNVMEEERLEKSPVNHITLEALSANRISEKDRKLLPVFNNYAEGAPSYRLYVKNLAKQTTEDDLRFIFSAFLTEKQDTEETFNIRLMQEGRMKGQAFITMQSVEMAQSALKETNGYILKDRPMVVQFARVGVAKKTNVETQAIDEAK